MKFCPFCHTKNSFKKHGFFYRKDRRSQIQRYFCYSCSKSFSGRTLAPDKYQKKSHLNLLIARMICERNSLRGTARIIGVSYSTVYRKFIFVADQIDLNQINLDSSNILYFDEMESIDHTKLKPLTIAIAVDENCKLLRAKVGTIKAKGHLAEISNLKYGHRENQSKIVCESVLELLASKVSLQKICTDQKTTYPKLIKKYFQHTLLESHKTERNFGLENRYLTKKFDPLFPINHKCGDLREKINRLNRKSWCTTKKVENLQRHLNLRVAYEDGLLAR